MEEELTLEELNLLMSSMQDREYRKNKFMAAMQGVDLEEGKKDETFEKIQMRAQAELAGKTEQEYVLGLIGIEIDEDDD